MPENPFNNLGSSANNRAVESSLRTMQKLRAKYVEALGAQTKANQKLAKSEAELHKSSKSLRAAQSEEINSLKAELAYVEKLERAVDSLNSTRQAAQAKESRRQKENKEAIANIKRVFNDVKNETGMIGEMVGDILQPLRTGIDNMLRNGSLPSVSRGITDVTDSVRELYNTSGNNSDHVESLGDSLSNAASAVEDFGNAAAESMLSTARFYNQSVELRMEADALAVRYGQTSEAVQKLQESFLNASGISLVDEGAVDQVSKISDAVMLLQARGVDAQVALSSIVDSARTSGRSFEEAAVEIEDVTNMVDALGERLNDTQGVLKGFNSTIRDETVRAIADVTRNLDSQVVSIQNVAAAYTFAQESAAKYGLSVKGQQAIAKTFAGAVTRERTDAAGFLAGRQMSSQINSIVRQRLREGETYGGLSDERKDAILSEIAQTFGEELTAANRASFSAAIRTSSEGGLGAQATYNLLAGTSGATEALIKAQMRGMGMRDISTTTLSRILDTTMDTSQLSELQKQTFTQMLQEGRTSEVAEKIDELRKSAEDKTKSEGEKQRAAIAAVISFKDPLKLLYNIADYLKHSLLTLGTIADLIPGGGGVRAGLETMIDIQLANQVAPLEEQLAKSKEHEQELQTQIAAARGEGRELDVESLEEQLRQTRAATAEFSEAIENYRGMAADAERQFGLDGETEGTTVGNNFKRAGNWIWEQMVPEELFSGVDSDQAREALRNITSEDGWLSSVPDFLAPDFLAPVLSRVRQNVQSSLVQGTDGGTEIETTVTRSRIEPGALDGEIARSNTGQTQMYNRYGINQ